MGDFGAISGRRRCGPARYLSTTCSLGSCFRLWSGAPQAELFRATARPWWNPFLWPSLIADDKWSIPYREPLGRAEPTGIPAVSCTPVRGAWEQADRQADAYLESL